MPFEKPTGAELINRFTSHDLSSEQVARSRAIRNKFLELAGFCVENTPCSPEQTRALNALDEAMFLFNAAIARTE